MKSTSAQRLVLILGACICLGFVGVARAEVLDDLKIASEALARDSEARAWQLYAPHEGALKTLWKELDPAFVTWVADQYRRQKRFSDAVALCDRVLADEKTLNPDFAASMMLVKGDVFRDQRNYAAARLEYQSITRHKDYKQTGIGKEAQFRVVDILRVTRDFEGAEEILERLLDYPELDAQAEAYYLKARIAYDRESLDEAREYMQEVKKRIPEHIETLFLEAELNLREDRLQDPELEIGSRVLMTYVIPGRPITMKMQDRNLAVVRGGAGVPVEMTTSSGTDAEVISLLPSPRDPTLFRGTVSTRLGEVRTNDLILEVTGSDIVSYNLEAEFQKANELKYEPKKMLVVSDAELTATSGDFVSSEERDLMLLQQRIAATRDKTLKAYEKERNTDIIRPGNAIRVQVVDYDRDLGPDLDKLFVGARTSSGDAVEGIELTETEAHSGKFRGTIPTVSAPPRATASDTAQGKNPGSAIRTGDAGAWVSRPASEDAKWFQVDLMTIHPLAETSLDFVTAGSVKQASLYSGAGRDLKEIASTQPSDKVIYGYVDLAQHFGEANRTAAYVYTEVISPGEQDAVFKIGSSDGVGCWLNGERVHYNLGGRAWTPEEDAVNVHLNDGLNSILLRVTQVTGPWGASLTISQSDGLPLETLAVVPPAKPGVVTQWHIFDRLTSEEIRVGKRVDVRKPIRIGGERFEWVPVSVAPTASLKIEDNRLTSVFHQESGIRRLRWVFNEIAGPTVSVKEIRAVDKFGEQIVPVEVEFSTAATNRILELGPGDRIDIVYRDERRVRTDELVTDTMRSGFHNAVIALAYEEITVDDDGEREIAYDPAIRYRAEVADKLVVLVEDYDADVSADLDTVKVLVETSEGDTLWLDAQETAEHSGEFVAILRLGDVTQGDTIKVGQDISLFASYADTENSDGRIERRTVVTEASDDAPELLLYQAALIADREGLLGREGEGPVVKVTLPVREEGAPVVTSLDTSLVFSVAYPAAALSSNSVFTALLATEREIAAAEVAGRDPNYLPVRMRLSKGEYAEFTASVEVRIGDPGTYADALAEDEEDEDIDLPIYVQGDDTVRVVVRTLDSDDVIEDRFKLASDAVLDFTDDEYWERQDAIYLGDFLFLRLSDRDQDVSSDMDSVTVTLKSGESSREVSLRETLPHSGKFTARVKTEPKIEGNGAAPEESDAFRVAYQDRIEGAYMDEVSVLSSKPRELSAQLVVHPGADGELATFTKLFSDEDIAVKTRLLTAEALFELAKDHRETEQKDLAEEEIAEGKSILEEAITDYPHTKHAPHAEFLLANLAQELEHYEEALERYNSVLSNWPDSEYAARSQLKKGICLEKMEDYDSALDAYVELTYSYPSSPLVSDAVVRLGQHFYRTKEYEVAGKIFGNFHDHHAEHELAAKALFLSGQSYLKGAEDRKQELDGHYDPKATEWLEAAIRQFDRLIDAYDDKNLRPEAMYWLADSYMKVSDMRNAYLSFKRLTWDYPESKWAKFARGQLVQNAAQFDRVKED